MALVEGGTTVAVFDESGASSADVHAGVDDLIPCQLRTSSVCDASVGASAAPWAGVSFVICVLNGRLTGVAVARAVSELLGRNGLSAGDDRLSVSASIDLLRHELEELSISCPPSSFDSPCFPGSLVSTAGVRVCWLPFCGRKSVIADDATVVSLLTSLTVVLAAEPMDAVLCEADCS